MLVVRLSGDGIWIETAESAINYYRPLEFVYRPRPETPDQMHTNEKEAMVEEDGMSVLALFLIRMGVTLNTLYYFILWETFFSGDLALKCEICINKVVSYLQMHKPNSL